LNTPQFPRRGFYINIKNIKNQKEVEQKWKAEVAANYVRHAAPILTGGTEVP